MKNRYFSPRKYTLVFLPAFVGLILVVPATAQNTTQAQQLVEQHCTGCHLIPTPEQLPKESWPFVLRWMGNYLGFKNTAGPLRGIVNENLVPDKKLISENDFILIKDYFIGSAKPQKRFSPAIKRSRKPLTMFEPARPIPSIPNGAFISAVKIDPSKKHTYVGFGTQNQAHLEIYNHQFEKVLNFNLESEPIHIVPHQQGFRLGLIGHFYFDRAQGQVIDVHPWNKARPQVKYLIPRYNRLTQSHIADFNNKGRKDLLVVGFGQGHMGRTSIFFEKANGEYGDEKILWNESGSLCAEVRDFDGNGLKDVMLLVAQNSQSLLLFLNKGNGTFERKLLHQKFAGFGYNSFVFTDFNGDNKIDIVTVSGNNMEIANPPPKPYHGIRVLINQGDLTWREELFLPVHGAIQALAEDFDKDGDIDIATSAFFPDWNQFVPETFIFFENLGDYRFAASTLQMRNWGRWMVMDAGDINDDGYKDILLGAAYIDVGIPSHKKVSFKRRAKQSPSLLYLLNSPNKN